MCSCYHLKKRMKVPKGQLRSRNLKMDRQYTGEKKNGQKNNDLQSITHNTKG
jgi:hypothetical protein